MTIELTECCVGDICKAPCGIASSSTTGVHSVLGILWERSGHTGKNAGCFRVKPPEMPTYLWGEGLFEVEGKQ